MRRAKIYISVVMTAEDGLLRGGALRLCERQNAATAACTVLLPKTVA
jgi:hypothetical protein